MMKDGNHPERFDLGVMPVVKRQAYRHADFEAALQRAKKLAREMRGKCGVTIHRDGTSFLVKLGAS